MTKREKQLDGLKSLIKGLESVVVAFSGGVDSALLAKVCSDVLGEKAIAVTAVSETYPVFELNQAKMVAKEIGIGHKILRTSELSIEDFARNPANRCYFCKTELFSKLKDVAEEINFKNIADGSNLDDTGDFRPGLKAAMELGSRSPLREAGLTKKDVRAISKSLGLSTWDKPAFACLSSRIPYGQKITVDKLGMIIKAEDFLRDAGFKSFRVRHHDTIARIEVPLADIGKLVDDDARSTVVKKLKSIGFTYVTIDLEGLRSGSMNEVLVEQEKSIGENAGLVIDDPVPGEMVNENSDVAAKPDDFSLFTVFTDGASRGNPGKAGIGVAIYAQKDTEGSPVLVDEIAEYIGVVTNNVAEYMALIKALENVVEKKPASVIFKLDSELLVKQINGAYKVRNKNLLPLYNRVMAFLRQFTRWEVVHVPRGENSVADALANEGIDSFQN